MRFFKEPKVVWETISIWKHSIITFALGEEGGLYQNANEHEQEGRNVSRSNIYFLNYYLVHKLFVISTRSFVNFIKIPVLFC